MTDVLPTAKVLRIPEHIEPIAFRSVLAAYTTAYRQYGRHPSVEEVHGYWPQLSQQSMGEILVTPEMREALSSRGIEVESVGLTHTQHLVVLALAVPGDRRSLKAKVETAGATMQQYASWKRNPVFQAAVRAQADRNFGEYLPEMKQQMLDQGLAGSFQHQQFIMETAGEGPKAREVQNAREIVMAMVAAVQKATVGHPEIREAIMAEMQMLRLAQTELGS